MDDELQARRGREAERLLKEPLLVEAFDAVRTHLRALMESAVTDEATLNAKKYLGLLNDVQGHLEAVVKNGRVAAETIKVNGAEKTAMSKWFKRGVA